MPAWQPRTGPAPPNPLQQMQPPPPLAPPRAAFWSDNLRVSSEGVSISAAELFGVNWAFSTLAALANGSCSVTCAPFTGEAEAAALGWLHPALNPCMAWVELPHAHAPNQS